jgi:hypothetical protein
MSFMFTNACRTTLLVAFDQRVGFGVDASHPGDIDEVPGPRSEVARFVALDEGVGLGIDAAHSSDIDEGAGTRSQVPSCRLG